MTRNTHANRGQALEELIERTATIYRANGSGFLVKIPTRFIPIRDNTGRIVTAKVDQKAEFDFIGHYQGTPVALEAKHTNGDRLSLSELQPHQRLALQEFRAHGTAAAVIYASFAFLNFYRIPVEVWILYERARDEKKQGLPPERYRNLYTGYLTGRQFETTGAASLTPEDLRHFRIRPADLLEGIISENEPFYLSPNKEEATK